MIVGIVVEELITEQMAEQMAEQVEVLVHSFLLAHLEGSVVATEPVQVLPFHNLFLPHSLGLFEEE